jgi:hypothetical protein
MPISPLDVLEQQAKSAVQNQLRTTQAQLLRETSIVGKANRILASGLRSRPEENRKRGGRTLRQGVYSQKAPDGYQRVSPVQELKTPPGYRAAILKRVVGAAAAILALAAVCILLYQFL